MFREEMPRVYELKDLFEGQDNPRTNFLSFRDTDPPLSGMKQAWLAYEQELRRLDVAAWEFLKGEVNRHRNKFNGGALRGRQQIMSFLNQARAYNYLVDIVCSHVRFIPEKEIDGLKTPDLEGVLNERKVLCEVKTLHISDLEMDRRKREKGWETERPDDRRYINFLCEKLKSHLCKAISQMSSYDDSYDVKRIAFIVINFDEFFSNKKAEYYSQIDRWLATDMLSGIDIVFYNQITPNHALVSMKRAQVINQAFYAAE
ncbi:MAG: hypothetical protein Q7U91_00005 [Sideroxyarcus sp.]|nr:hypothetical protein [Sideroxyarcus sp.]